MIGGFQLMHSDWLFQLKQCDARYQFMHCDWWISIHFPFHSLLVWKGVVRSLSVSSVLKVILCLFWQALKFLFLHSYLYLSGFLKTGPLKSCSLRVWCEWLFYFSFKNSPTLQSWQYKNNRLQSLPSFFFSLLCKNILNLLWTIKHVIQRHSTKSKT